MPHAQRAPQAESRSVFRSVALWAALGTAAGALLPFLFFGGMLFQRLFHAASGGGGESAEWGEAVFYLVLFAVPAGAAGAVVGGLLGTLGHFARRREQPPPPPGSRASG